MANCPHDLLDGDARRWRRWLWETAETGEPCPGLSFDDAVYQGSDLAKLLGEVAYAALVDQLVSDPNFYEIKRLARQVLDERFPSSCRCRTQSAMNRDDLDFTGSNVYRSLYFSDKSVTDHMRILFRRTPEVELLECRECGETWLRALDQIEWMQHLVLMEPADMKRIVEEGVWPTALDKFEDAWVSQWGIVGRNSPLLRSWQAEHNGPEAFARFGK